MPRKRTAMPRYIAAKLLLTATDRAADDVGAMAAIARMPITEAKHAQVLAVVESLTAGLRIRLKKIIDRSEAPYPQRPPKEKPDG